MLTIWSDIPDPDPTDPTTFSKPGDLLWKYRADMFEVDEVMVGFDKHPEGLHIVPGREAVYRYSVRLPEKKWFTQTGEKNVYWFSVVAVYDRDNLGPGAYLTGPAIVEAKDTTIWIPPGHGAEVDGYENLMIQKTDLYEPLAEN